MGRDSVFYSPRDMNVNTNFFAMNEIRIRVQSNIFINAKFWITISDTKFDHLVRSPGLWSVCRMVDLRVAIIYSWTNECHKGLTCGDRGMTCVVVLDGFLRVWQRMHRAFWGFWVCRMFGSLSVWVWDYVFEGRLFFVLGPLIYRLSNWMKLDLVLILDFTN